MIVIERAYFQQKAEDWLQHGDYNTKFFLASLAQKNYNRAIIVMQDKRSELKSINKEIGDALVEYFSLLLGLETKSLGPYLEL